MDLATALQLMTAERDALRVALAGRKTMTREAFDTLTPAERMSHVKAGGLIIDEQPKK